MDILNGSWMISLNNEKKSFFYNDLPPLNMMNNLKYLA
jgi:hypothetical protein